MKIKLQAFDSSVQIEWNNSNSIATFNYKKKEYGEKIVNIATLLYSCPDSEIHECNKDFTQIHISLNNLLSILTKLN